MRKLILKEHEVGKTTYQKGCFTLLKQIAGQTLHELEIRLGFRYGRLAQGTYVVQASELPTENQFDLIGYTNVSIDRMLTDDKYDKNKAINIHGNYDHAILKRNIVIPSWDISGPNSLVKLIPVIEHSEIETYPSSQNRISQWLVNTEIRCSVIAFVPPGKIFTLFKSYI